MDKLYSHIKTNHDYRIELDRTAKLFKLFRDDVLVWVVRDANDFQLTFDTLEPETWIRVFYGYDAILRIPYFVTYALSDFEHQSKFNTHVLYDGTTSTFELRESSS